MAHRNNHIVSRLTLAVLAIAVAACATVRNPDSLTISFDPRSHEIGVPAVIEGQRFTFLVDTALEPSAFDREAAARLGLAQLADDAEVEGAGQDRATAYPSVVPQLSIGGERFGPIEVLVADLAKLSARYGAPIHGVLGYSLLKDHAVLVDYAASEITFHDGAARTEPSGCASVYRFPLQFLAPDDKLILIPGLRIAGTEVPAFLDTGSSSGLRIDVNAAAVAPIRAVLPLGTKGTSVGARGVASRRSATLPHPVTLGPLSVENVQVSLVEDAPLDVGVGNRFFEALGARLLVDIPAGRVAIYSDCGESTGGTQ